MPCQVQAEKAEEKEKGSQGQIPCPSGSLRKLDGREAVLTPARCTELEHVSADVNVVDTPEEKVEVEAFNGHPGEAAEQRVVQDGSQRCAC